MQDFANHYFTEKTLATRDFQSDNPNDNKCLAIGQRIADRFGLRFDGWWDFSYQFTIPEGLPNEKNTLLAKNEEEIISKIKERFPDFLSYTMEKNFPNGYKPDPTIPTDIQPECEPLDLDKLKKGND